MGRAVSPAGAAGFKSSKNLQSLLLTSVSAFACGIVLAHAPNARAQTISTSTNQSVTATGANIFVDPNVDLTGSPAISNDGVTTGTILNQGTLDSSGSGILIVDG